MPELPDVEGFRRVFAEHAVRKTVLEVEVHDTQVLHGVTAAALARTLGEEQFAEPWRHGKWLLAPLHAGKRPETMMLHFGMTGSLEWSGEGEVRHRHDRVSFAFPDGALRYRDMRKLKGLYLAEDAAQVDELLGDLGPDALAITRAELAGRLGGRSRQVKAALSDQSMVAGLGNLLVDEILWQARIEPRRRGSDLSPSELNRVHAKMNSVLRQSVRAERVPPRASWLTGRRDEPSGSCPRCGTTLSRGRAGSRSTTWCPHCQR